MKESIRIPDDRKAILIGKNGRTKIDIEKRTKTKLTIGEDIIMEAEPDNLFKAENIIKAIGRGFSPARAFNLLKEDFELDVMIIQGTPNQIKRLSSRVIGRNGRARRSIEMISGAHLSVYGKTVSIIGKHNEINIARKAVEMLLTGRTHNYVYKKLNKSLRGSIVTTQTKTTNDGV